jgi:hypothetical protein
MAGELRQSLSGQIETLKGAGAASIYQEKVSGVWADRPQLAKLMAKLMPGDIVVVTKLDRLGIELPAQSLPDECRTFGNHGKLPAACRFHFHRGGNIRFGYATKRDGRGLIIDFDPHDAIRDAKLCHFMASAQCPRCSPRDSMRSRQSPVAIPR